MGPGLYSEIGKKARDLLYKDYQTDQKFSFTTCSAGGVAITSSGTKKNDLILGEVQAQLKRNGVSTDVKVNSDSNFHIIQVNSAPSLHIQSAAENPYPDHTADSSLE